MTATRPIRVLVADDHFAVRLGLVTLINGQTDMKVVAEACRGPEVVELWREHRPDVTLMDLRMPGMSGVDALKAIRADEPRARVIMLTMHQGDQAVYDALQAGARGYLLKDGASQEILSAIRDVHAGARRIPPEIAARIVDRLQYSELSERELGVLTLIARGRANKEIADELSISEATVKNHVSSVLEKLDARDRTHAVMVALERNILHVEDVQSRDEPHRS
jgi:DNA-binding NarL/FixJ family response regulator